MNEINKPVSPKRWRKSISLPNGTEKSVCVKEIDNGFLIEVYAYTPGKDSFEKTVYSKENPFKDMDPEIDSKKIEDFLNPPFQLI